MKIAQNEVICFRTADVTAFSLRIGAVGHVTSATVQIGRRPCDPCHLMWTRGYSSEVEKQKALQDIRRLTVLLTRAKTKLVIFRSLRQAKSSSLSKLVDFVEKHGWVVVVPGDDTRMIPTRCPTRIWLEVGITVELTRYQ